MNRIESHTTVDLFFQLNWQSDDVMHTDSYSARHVNLWRDILPCRIAEKLHGKHAGDDLRLSLAVEDLFSENKTPGLVEIKRCQFGDERIFTTPPQPRLGRYYPKGILKDIAGIFRANTTPFRVVGQDNGRLCLDMRHPLVDKQIEMAVTLGTTGQNPYERGGSLNHWGEVITEGVGMQARWQDIPTRFFDDYPFARRDERADQDFYTKPRLVQHLDDTAIDVVRQIYARFLHNNLRVLDLMSSWTSHLPDDVDLKQLSGLGMNKAELDQNPKLSDHVVHDLNQQPGLPYQDASYDLVICSVSVEYLTKPFQVFADVARILRPKGQFVVVFSNRWFDTKAIRIWSELHEFERMGLVLEYFRKDNLYSDLHTYSVRGLARPLDDKYIGHTLFSDPIYAVWGRRR